MMRAFKDTIDSLNDQNKNINVCESKVFIFLYFLQILRLELS